MHPPIYLISAFRASRSDEAIEQHENLTLSLLSAHYPFESAVINMGGSMRLGYAVTTADGDYIKNLLKRLRQETAVYIDHNDFASIMDAEGKLLSAGPWEEIDAQGALDSPSWVMIGSRYFTIK